MAMSDVEIIIDKLAKMVEAKIDCGCSRYSYGENFVSCMDVYDCGDLVAEIRIHNGQSIEFRHIYQGKYHPCYSNFLQFDLADPGFELEIIVDLIKKDLGRRAKDSRYPGNVQ